MNENIKLIEFSEIRKIAVEMRALLIDKLGLYPEEFNFKSSIEDDLGCTGDDAEELLEEIYKKYQVDFQDFNFDEYFYSEGNASASMLIYLLIIEIVILFLNFIVFTNKSLTDKITAYKRRLLNKVLKPLTVGDLITSAIEKKFTLRKDLQYRVNYQSSI